VYNFADSRWPNSNRQIGTQQVLSFLPALWATQDSGPLQLNRLVSSGSEIRSSAAAFGAENPTFLTGFNASRAKLQRALASSPAVLHIATHVLQPRGRPDQAIIAMSMVSKTEADILTTSDVSVMRADGTLVVLSGCSAGAGKVLPSAGLIGMARAWLTAGARGVVASMWPTPDDTGALFQSFYKYLQPGHPPDSGNREPKALQQAQLAMLQSHTWRSEPRYWAAYFLLDRE
jgi:CHAT domain-containing protein